MFCTKEEPTSFLLHCKKKNKVRQRALFSLLLNIKPLDVVVTWNFGLLHLFLRLVMSLGASPSCASPGPTLHLAPGKDFTSAQELSSLGLSLYAGSPLARQYLLAPMRNLLSLGFVLVAGPALLRFPQLIPLLESAAPFLAPGEHRAQGMGGIGGWCLMARRKSRV